MKKNLSLETLGANTRQRKFLEAYLDTSNSKTFFNATESARVAGYKGTSPQSLSNTGNNIVRQFERYIALKLDTGELSEISLKKKLIDLLDAKKTIFFTHEGEVRDERQVDALDTQTKALKMAINLQGLAPPNRHEIAIAGVFKAQISADMPATEAAEVFQRLVKSGKRS